MPKKKQTRKSFSSTKKSNTDVRGLFITNDNIKVEEFDIDFNCGIIIDLSKYKVIRKDK